MGQFGFFDTNNRLEALSAKGDPLEAIDAIVPWDKDARWTKKHGKKPLRL